MMNGRCGIILAPHKNVINCFRDDEQHYRNREAITKVADGGLKSANAIGTWLAYFS
jgi:hypothetical protein